jgi:hypothetical protein
MTLIPYNLGIPNAPDNPSVDQPNMKVNNDNIPALVSVDHVNFNVNGSGQHNQVTFNANHVPVGFLPPVLYTNNDALSNPQLFYATTDAAHSTNQYNVINNGASGGNASALVLGGLIVKCGRFVALTGSSVAVVYTSTGLTAFPNNTLSVTVSVSNNALTAGVQDGTLSATGFTILKSNSAAATIFFIAIGY